jgi:hypothetical protein
MEAGPRHIPAEHPLVKNEKGGGRLIPRGGDVALGGKMAEKGAHLKLVQRRRVAPSAPDDEALDPMNVPDANGKRPAQVRIRPAGRDAETYNYALKSDDAQARRRLARTLDLQKENCLIL